MGDERKDSKGTCAITFREENFELSGQHSPPKCNLLSDLQFFKWLGLANGNKCLALWNGPSTSQGIPSSLHRATKS